jgi:3-oxoacyl-[acyl-carrier protein] reductase
VQPLEGQQVLVAGGAGEVGEGIVRQFLRAGATVIVPSRREERLEALRDQCANEATERLITHQVNLGDMASAQGFATTLQQECGALHHVVASLGGWWQGTSLIELDFATWQHVIDNGLTAHFVCARAFLPQMLHTNSSYTFINGSGALDPFTGSGPISVSDAAQIMLQRVLTAELAQTDVRINSLLITTSVTTRSNQLGLAHWLSADDVGQYCVALATGDIKGEVIVFESREQLPS